MSDLANQLAASFVTEISTNDTLRDSLLSALSIPGQLSSDATTKSTKQEVNYRRADSSKDKRKTQSPRCGTCDHFLDNKCEIVAGQIYPDYVCDDYEHGVSDNEDRT